MGDPEKKTIKATPDLKEFCVLEQDEKIHCACSQNIVTKTGTGATTRRHLKKRFFYLRQAGEGKFDMWAVNAHHVPSGKKKTISLETLMADYEPEVAHYVAKIAPAVRQLQKHIARGDKHRKNSKPYSAEVEYKGALSMDQKNVRATFGLGLTYLEHGEREKGESVFHSLVELDGAFDPEYKHLFNDLGIQLRKNGLFGEAVDYYSRALKLSPDDENLHFNLARSHFEKKEWLPCLRHLCLAMELNPNLEQGHDFCRYLLKQLQEGTSDVNKDLGDLAGEVAASMDKALGTDKKVQAGHLKKLRKAVEKRMAAEQ